MMSRVDMEHLRCEYLSPKNCTIRTDGCSAQGASTQGPFRVPDDSVDGLRTVPNVPMELVDGKLPHPTV